MNDTTGDMARMTLNDWVLRMATDQIPYQAQYVAQCAAIFRVVGNDDLMRLTRLSRNTLDRWKKWLVDNGWIVVTYAGMGAKGAQPHPAYRGQRIEFTDYHPPHFHRKWMALSDSGVADHPKIWGTPKKATTPKIGVHPKTPPQNLGYTPPQNLGYTPKHHPKNWGSPEGVYITTRAHAPALTRVSSYINTSYIYTYHRALLKKNAETEVLRNSETEAAVEAKGAETFELTPPPAPEPKKRGARKSAAGATRLPDDWVVPQEWLDRAKRQFGFSTAQGVAEAAKFAEHWINRTGPRALKRNWVLTWDQWCRNAIGYGLKPEGAAEITPSTAGGESVMVGPNNRPWGWWRSKGYTNQSFDVDFWRRALDTHRPNGTWPWWHLGAPPGDPECIVHPDILAERGYEKIYQGKITHV